MRRWLGRAGFVLLGLFVAFAVGACVHAPVCLPFDFLLNLGPTLAAPDLRAPDDGKVRVAFLQHGLWRTSQSMDRLARTLRANGYEVVNAGYPSTEDRIEGHAARLGALVEARFDEGAVDELYFVGHSMGGLVIEEYLRHASARAPTACVYIASPHRGAILADRRQHWFLFELAMGHKAAKQLATTDPFHRQPIPFGERSGTIVGDIGIGNGSIPGRDDGTVGVDEATFATARASVTVPYGHSRIAVRSDVLRQVLSFLRDRTFLAGGQKR